MQTVEKVLTSATDSVTLINGINTDGSNSVYAGATIDKEGNIVASTMTQAEIPTSWYSVMLTILKLF